MAYNKSLTLRKIVQHPRPLFTDNFIGIYLDSKGQKYYRDRNGVVKRA